jgi:hypothetical protein
MVNDPAELFHREEFQAWLKENSLRTTSQKG